MLGAITWDVSPIMFEILGREVRWYGLFFALGLMLLGPMIAERMWKHEKLRPEWLNALFIYVVVATVVGARLGHVLFYNPSYYLANPIEILYIWEGGLASHGGVLGIIIALWLYSRRVTGRSILFALDRIAIPAALVAAMIRLGNLMNSEIYGGPTDQPWGFRFITNIHEWLGGAEPIYTVPSHPTQIYEALAYLVTFALCSWLYWCRDAARRFEGLIIGTLFICIFGFRFVVEGIKNVQEPWEVDMIANYGINMGQALSIPLIIAGIWLVVRALRRGASAPLGRS